MADAMTGFLISSVERPEEVYKIGLTSTRLLLALGDLIVGWLLIRQAEVARARLDAADDETQKISAADRDFYVGKLAAARFFAATVLPRLTVDRRITAETSLDLMDVPETAF